MSPNSSLISLFAGILFCVCKLAFTGSWKSADGQWDYKKTPKTNQTKNTHTKKPKNKNKNPPTLHKKT